MTVTAITESEDATVFRDLGMCNHGWVAFGIRELGQRSVGWVELVGAFDEVVVRVGADEVDVKFSARTRQSRLTRAGK
jgi:hypothetical protein